MLTTPVTRMRHEGRRKRDSRRVPQLEVCQETARIPFESCYGGNSLGPHKGTEGPGQTSMGLGGRSRMES